VRHLQRIEDTEIDHIVPHSKGGSNARSNLQLVHWQCNRSKATKSHEDFQCSMLLWPEL
jgi:5-methylcytosine-specific restriction endonuclease McrA